MRFGIDLGGPARQSSWTDRDRSYLADGPTANRPWWPWRGYWPGERCDGHVRPVGNQGPHSAYPFWRMRASHRGMHSESRRRGYSAPVLAVARARRRRRSTTGFPSRLESLKFCTNIVGIRRAVRMAMTATDLRGMSASQTRDRCYRRSEGWSTRNSRVKGGLRGTDGGQTRICGIFKRVVHSLGSDACGGLQDSTGRFLRTESLRERGVPQPPGLAALRAKGSRLPPQILGE